MISYSIFLFFSLLMLGFAISVIFLRNPVSSALSLVVSFISLAVLFITLGASFLGIIQILVYAGAIMVLFLFIIMLLNLKNQQYEKISFFIFGSVVLVICFFISFLIKVISSSDFFWHTMPLLKNNISDIQLLGITLFTSYTLPFEIIGVLLLVATLGVVLISKNDVNFLSKK